ncbi:MAG: hypothetical protein ACPGWR_01860 [Ardenticatenaceae bacterium]
MGMKEIILPTELLNLPQPWGETDFSHRREQIKRLSYEPNEIRTALNVLERCLHSLSILTPPKESDDSIPESLMDSWVFTAHWLASEMPTLDELRLYKIEGKLKEYGIESPSPTLTRELAKEWLWSVVWGIGKAALRWVQRALQKTREPVLISDFLYVAERYWLLVEPDLGSSLLSRSAMIGWQKALPLFESVEQNPKASEDILETVRDYRDLILDNPHKWLPESDAFSEWPTSESEDAPVTQKVTQPALKLAYAP